MKSYTALTKFLTLIITIILAGCASLGDELKTHEQSSEYITAHTATISVHLRNNAYIINSSVRSSGDSPNELSSEDIVTVASMPSNWGHLQLVSTPDIKTAYLNQVEHSSQDISPVLSIAASALGRIISRMDYASNQNIGAKIFVADDSQSIYYEESYILEGATQDGFLPILSIASFPSRAASGTWWLEAVGDVAHEISHLNQGLAGLLEDDSIDPVNVETAAAIIEYCASFDMLSALAKQQGLETVNLKIQALDELEAFPGLQSGYFAPIVEHLSHWPDATSKGKIIASALIYLNTDQGVLDFSSQDRYSGLDEFCHRHSNSVYDFVNGKM